MAKILGCLQFAEQITVCTLYPARLHADEEQHESQLRGSRDICEPRLAQLWEGVLGRDDVGVQDGFFDLGGDLTTAKAVLGAIVTQLDVELSIETFRAGPTIEALGCHLRAASARINEQPIVALRPSGA